MTFDSHSLERLKELGRTLPKELSKSQQIYDQKIQKFKTSQLHPVEIETNPEQLFRELMEISPDGNVPPHLLDRLKSVESNRLKNQPNKNTEMNNNPQEITINESQSLYTQFEQFLLEDDID